MLEFVANASAVAGVFLIAMGIIVSLDALLCAPKNGGLRMLIALVALGAGICCMVSASELLKRTQWESEARKRSAAAELEVR